MPTTSTPTMGDTQIRGRIDGLARALRAKDLDALMAHYSPDIVTFDLMPLQTLGAEAYRKNFEAWFASVQGPIDFEIRDLNVTLRDDIAFCHYLGHVRSTRISGEKTDYWVRVSLGLQQTNGRWMVTHEHVSLPFLDGETLQARLLRVG
jgi:uncharacterized protein (TIGR02246 family)